MTAAALERIVEATEDNSLQMLLGTGLDTKDKVNGKFLLEDISFYELTREELASKGILNAGGYLFPSL